MKEIELFTKAAEYRSQVYPVILAKLQEQNYPVRNFKVGLSAFAKKHFGCSIPDDVIDLFFADFGAEMAECSDEDTLRRCQTSLIADAMEKAWMIEHAND